MDTRARYASPQDTETAPLDARRLGLMTLLGLSALVVCMVLLVSMFQDEVKAIARAFVDSMGGFGVFLGYYIPDACTLPLPNDVFAAFGLIGGLGFWEVVFWGTLGSYLGGATGYMGGRLLVSQSERLANFLEGRALAPLKRYGGWALLAAALTPLPFNFLLFSE